MRVVGEIFRYKLELLCYDKCGSAKPQIKSTGGPKWTIIV